MSALNTDFRTAVELTARARVAADEVSATLPIGAFMPNVENTTLSYTFSQRQKEHVDIPTYRGFDTPAPYGKVEGVAAQSGKLLPISRKLPVSEYTELQFARNTDALGEVLDRYATDLGRGVAFRLELARAEAIRTDKLELNENGVIQTIDYGRDAALTITAKWSAAAAKPIDDVIAWRQLVGEKGRVPNAALLSLDVLEKLATNKQVIGYALGRTADLPVRVTYDDVRSVLASFGIVSVTVVDDAYSNYDLGSQPFPAGTFILVPGAAGLLGSTQIGVPAEALQASYGISATEQAGIFAGAFSREDPIGIDVLVSAVALPVITEANSTLSAVIS